MPLAGFPSVLSHWRLDDMNGIKQHGKMFHKQQQQVAHIRPLPAAVAQHRLCSNQSISPTCWAHSSKLAAARVMLSAHAGTDRQMDGHHNIKFIVHRPSCAYYADTVPINWLLLQHSAGWHRKKWTLTWHSPVKGSQVSAWLLHWQGSHLPPTNLLSTRRKPSAQLYNIAMNNMPLKIHSSHYTITKHCYTSQQQTT